MKLWSKAQSRSRIRLNRKCWQQKPYKTNCQKINFSFLKMIAMSSPAKPQSKPNISMAFVWIIKSLQFGSIVRTLGFLYATKKCNSHASFHRQRGIVCECTTAIFRTEDSSLQSPWHGSRLQWSYYDYGVFWGDGNQSI